MEGQQTQGGFFNPSKKRQQKDSSQLVTLAENLNHQIMPFEQFREQLNKIATVEEKFILLKSQFAFDPYSFDMSQFASAQAMTSQQNQLVSHIKIIQIDMIVCFFEDLINQHINKSQLSLEASQPCVDILLFVPQIQALVSILVMRVYTQMIFSEMFNHSVYNQNTMIVLKNVTSIVSNVVNYLLLHHGPKLKPTFRNFILYKLGECLTLFSHKNEKDIYTRTRTEAIYAMPANTARLKPTGKDLGFSIKPMSAQLEEQKEGDLPMRTSYIHNDNGLSPLDREVLTSIFHSIIVTGNSLFLDPQNQNKQQESVITQILCPLISISTQYESVFFDSLDQYSLKSKITNLHDPLTIFNQDIFTNKKYQQSTLLLLALRSFSRILNVNNNRLSKVSINNSLMKQQDSIAKAIDELIKKQIVYFLIHNEWIKNEQKLEQERKNLLPDIKKIARPMLKRQNTVSALITKNIGNLLPTKRGPDSQQSQGQTELESPDHFVMRLLGDEKQNKASETKSPTEKDGLSKVLNQNNNDQTSRNSDQRLNTRQEAQQMFMLNRGKGVSQAVNPDDKNMQNQDPINVLSEIGSFKEMISSSNLKYTTKDLSKITDSQLNWIRVSHNLMEISIDILKTSFGLSKDQVIQHQYLFISLFDLFKTTLYFICQFKHYSDFFENVDELTQIADIVDYPCYLTTTFQIMMTITTSDNKNFIELFYDEFQDIIDLFKQGRYDQVDRNYILRIYYHIFFEKIITCGTPQKLNLITLNLLNFFNEFFYNDTKIKEVESLDFLKYKKNYQLLLSKTKQQEESKFQSEGTRVNPLQETNKILFQQQVLGIISTSALFKKNIYDLCWKEIDKILMNDFSIEVNETKLFQYLKLAISLMKTEQIASNKEFYKILLDDQENAIYTDYQTWKISGFYKDNFNRQFWETIIDKIKTYLIAQYELMAKRAQKEMQRDPKQPARDYKEETKNLLSRMTEKRDGIHKSAMPIITDMAFNYFKRFLIYGIQNPDICNQLQKKLYEIARDIKDFEMSFDLKFAILKVLIINKERSNDAEDLLKEYAKAQKALLEYIKAVNLKMSTAKSAVRTYLFEEHLQRKEQEKKQKMKRINLFVDINISLLTNYMDIKENFYGTNNKRLHLIEYDSFSKTNQYLKALILNSEFSPRKLTMQLMRIYFFNRIKLQNMCELEKKMALESKQNNLLYYSQKILEFLLSFLVDIYDQMPDQSVPSLLIFVETLHQKIVQQQSIQTVKLAKSLNQNCIKHLKKILIALREKDNKSDKSITQANAMIQEVIVKIFNAVPNALVLREFFSFFREIFYYNKDMDQVDFDLAVDTLQILNNLLKQSHVVRPAIENKKGLEIDPLSISDYFYFSDITPGFILSDNFKIPSEGFTISMLFKLNALQLKSYFEKNQSDILTMTLFQLTERNAQENNPPYQAIIHIQKDKIKILNYEVKIDDNWHLMLIKFTQKKKFLNRYTFKVKYFIDDLQKPVNNETKFNHKFNHRHNEYIISYGCNLIEFGQEIKVNNFIQGQMSLPFIFQKFDFEKQCENAEMRRVFQDFIVESIQRKQIYSVQPYDIQNFFKQRTKTCKDFAKEFECNELNEAVILKHIKAIELQHIGAVHQMKSHSTIVGLGGFKTLYPIFEKSLSSNLKVSKKSEIWKWLFKILRTMMNIEPTHVFRLFRNKHLIEILKYCLIRGGRDHLISKGLLTEVINVLKDIHTNQYSDILEGFYKRFLFDILLSEQFCNQYFDDEVKKRRSQVYMEVVENLYSMFFTEETKNRKQNKLRKLSQSSGVDSLILSDINEFFTEQTSLQCYSYLIKLILKYNTIDYLKQANKLGAIITRIILKFQYKEGLNEIIQNIQGNQRRKIGKTTLLIYLKILNNVIKEPIFMNSKHLNDVLKSQVSFDHFFALLNQTNSLLDPSSDSDGKLEDGIIATSFRVLMLCFRIFNDYQKLKVVDKSGTKESKDTSKQEFIVQKDRFLANILAHISKNPRGIQMTKTLCSIILVSIEQARNIKVDYGKLATSSSLEQRVKYNHSFLKEFIKEEKVLKLMASQEFDNDLFSMTIKLFNHFDSDTKLGFLEFYRQLIESKEHNIEDFESFRTKKFNWFMKGIYSQQDNIISIVTLSLNTGDPNIVGFSERIVTSTIKCFIDTSLNIDVQGTIQEDEQNFIQLIKKLLFIMDNYHQSQILVLNEVLKYTQEVVNWVWSYVLQDTNRTNLNIKLLILLQIVEDIVVRKSKDYEIIRDLNFLETIARLLLIFDHTKLIYFDYPNPPIIDTRKSMYQVDAMRYHNTMFQREINFTQGGPLRVFLSLLLQMLRKHKDQYETFEIVGQLFRFLIFKEESQFINKFKHTITIDSQPQQHAPLFKMIYNFGQKKHNYKLGPLDLTKEFMENFVESKDLKDSIVQTPGFLPLVLLTEVFELIRRKTLLFYSDFGTQVRNGFQADEQKKKILWLYQLFFDILKNAYFSDEFKENIGYMLITITDPRLKEELYVALRQTMRGDQTYSKLYYMSKPYHPQGEREGTFNEIEMSLEGSDPNIMDGTLNALAQMTSGRMANMKDSYFKRYSDLLEETKKGDNQNIDVNKQEELQKLAEQLFRDANLEKTNKMEQAMIIDETKDQNNAQEEMINFFTAFYFELKDHFEIGRSTAGGQMAEEDFIDYFKRKYFDNEKTQQIFLAIRMVSSEKLRNVLTWVYITCNKQEQEIKHQLKHIQIETDAIKQKQLKPIPMKKAESQMSQSQQNVVDFKQQQQKGIASSLFVANAFQRKESADSVQTYEFEYNQVPNIKDIINPPQSAIKKQESELKTHRTLQFYYTKQQYQKMVKRLQDDPSSIWYDNLEQIKKDYADLKEIYELVSGPQRPPQLQQQLDLLEQSRDQGEESKQRNMPRAPQAMTQKQRQYDHFVRQRRNADTWGRMMLLKPDRKYKETKFWMTHLYFVHDFLKSLLAISLLDDQDFSDYQHYYKILLQQQQQQQMQQQQDLENTSQDEVNNDMQIPLNNTDNIIEKQPQSEMFRKLRELLMNKIEQNDFLYSLLTNPDDLTQGPKPFVFQPIEPKNDLTLEWKCDVQYVAVEGAYYGELYISNQFIMFKSKFNSCNPDYKFALHNDQMLKKKNKIWHLSNIEQLFKRRFLLIHQAFEFFTKEKKSYFFNLLTEENCKTFFDKIQEINKKFKNHKIEIITNPRDEFNNKKNFKKDWLKGLISNQQFLLLVNKYSGRSFNDLSQYPIFPWVIDVYDCDYKELQMKQEKGEGYRDLALHTGIISDVKRQYAINQYNKDEDAKIIYGNDRYNLKFGFSNKMYSLAYLIRLEPFTDSFITVNKNLDNPDRIMYSIKDQWGSINNLNYFGKNREGYSVNEVMLPTWAKNEHDFIRINREALDSKPVHRGLKMWLDMLFGTKQKDEFTMNIFYCYAYETYLANKGFRDLMQEANIDTIKEFMQVPHQIFTERLFTDKQIQSQQVKQYYFGDDGESLADIQTPDLGNMRAIVPGKNDGASHSSVQKPGMMFGKNKKTNMKSVSPMIAPDKSMILPYQKTSLIQKFIEFNTNRRPINELNQMSEVSTLEKDLPNIFHMEFSMNGKCMVFINDKDGFIKCAACRENFIQDELKNPCNLGLKLSNLKGGYENIFQIFFDKNLQKNQLLFTCQNLDNSIKVYDLNIKKGYQLVHQEQINNSIVTSIKFSADNKYFISGDTDGVIHHYQRASDDVYDYSASILANQSNIMKQEYDNKVFPFHLKYKLQDHVGAVLAIDINLTLDMYVTASADGTIALRCLRTSQIWQQIQNERLTTPGIHVQSLKLSLHGYIILVIKTPEKLLTQVFSINGDNLLQTQRENYNYEFKYAQLTLFEDQLIMAVNQKMNVADQELQGILRVVRLYDLEKVHKQDNLQRVFYPYVSKQNNKLSNQQSSKIPPQQSNLVKMPTIKCFALSNDEGKMNIILNNDEIICLDISKVQIFKQLDDFGLA